MGLRMLAISTLAQLATAGGTPFPRRDMSAASFPHHPSREVFSLTGDWDFEFVNHADYSANATVVPAKLAFGKTQAVPSAWDAQWGTGLQYSRGAGFYRAKVTIPVQRPARLHFQACSIFCRIFVDGAPVANSTRGGFTPFWVDVPAAATAIRTVVVMASNVFDPKDGYGPDHTLLTPTQAEYYDFYQYGGLLREVTLHVLPAQGSPSVERVVVDPLAAAGSIETGAAGPSGAVNVTVVLHSATTGKAVTLGLCWDLPAASPPCADSASHQHVDGVITLAGLQVPKWAAWTPTDAKPKLHTLTVFVLPTSDGDDTATLSDSAGTPIDGIQV